MKYEVEEVQDFLIIHIIGNMTLKAHLDILDNAITEHIQNGFHKFLFNLEKLESLDVDGVGIFINCLTDVDAHGGGAFILVEDDKVFSVIKDAGLDQMMPIYRNREDFTEAHGVSQFD